MKIAILDAQYTYDASLKTITLSTPYDSLNAGQVYSIVNITRNRVIYNSDEQRADAITISGAVITHTAEVGTDADADKLQIIVDVGDMTNPVNVNVTSGEDASAYESVSVDATVGGVSLTSGTYGDATRAEMTLEVAQIRVRKDGTGPTVSEGHVVEEGDTILLESAADIANFKAIRTGGVSGVLKVTYSE